MDGILLINKPYGVTSRDVVNSVSKILKTKKVGHTGTLDPIATGVLVLCVGKYTKLADILTSEKKEYIAEAIFGLDSDTLDITGNILKDEKFYLDKNEIISKINKFKCVYEQEVPIYSAVKVNGKKLYEYARENKKVILPSKRVEIYNIEVLNIDYIDNHVIVKFKALVSKGTYIRSLIRDIAISMNTCGIMKSLIRTKQGIFNIEDCINIFDLKNNKSLINAYEYLNDYEKIIVSNDELFKIKNGSIIYNKYGYNKVAFFDSNKKLIALYQEYEKDKSKLKPFKIIDNN